MMNETTVTIDKATSANQVTRERRYARGAQGGAVNLEVYRDRGAVKVSWNVNRGRCWAKGWKATLGTEAEAMAFAETKWAQLVAWLEKLTPEESGGAAAAFSAQVASMR